MTKREAKRIATEKAAIILQEYAAQEGQWADSEEDDRKITSAMHDIADELLRRVEKKRPAGRRYGGFTG